MSGYTGSSFSWDFGIYPQEITELNVHGEVGYTFTIFSFYLYNFLENLKFKNLSTCS